MASTNIAAGRAATASSYMLSFVPNRVTDGKTADSASRWVSGIVPGQNPWIMVDLGNQYCVNRFVLSSLATLGWDFPAYCNLQVTLSCSTNMSTWITIQTVSSPSATIDYTSPSPVICRYVRAVFNQGMQANNQCAEVVEFQIYDTTSPYLQSLTLSNGTLTPAFNGTTTFAYTSSVDGSVAGVTVTPVTYSPTAAIKVNNVAVSSGSASQPITLAYGGNAIAVSVTDGGATQNYTVTVTKFGPLLTNLTLSSGSLSPVFNSNTLSYTASVGDSVSSVTLTPTALDPGAAITVNGQTVQSGQPSQTIAVAYGPATNISVVVTDGGQTQTYTVTVKKSSPYLSNLLIKYGKGTVLQLSPTPFTPLIQSYAASLPKTVSTVMVTATAQDPYATLQANGNPLPSGVAYSLTLDSNSIEIDVFPSDGSSKLPYTISLALTLN
jgi:F5/8 type C domain.